MKNATIYTAATVLLGAIIFCAIGGLKSDDQGLKAKAAARATAIEEAQALFAR